MRRRKNLIPTLVFAILSWAALGYLIYAFPPNSPLPFPPPLDTKFIFFFVVFLAFFFSFSLLFQNTRRGLLVAVGLTALALLRLFKLFHPLYVVLILALLVTIELYFLKK